MSLKGHTSNSKLRTKPCKYKTASYRELATTQADLDLVQAQYAQLQADYNKLQTDYAKIVNMRDFNSLDELKSWLAEDTTDCLPYLEGIFDCDDFAHTLMLNAFLDGYIVGIFATADHQLNICFVGDMVYLVEPQDDLVVFVAYTWE